MPVLKIVCASLFLLSATIVAGAQDAHRGQDMPLKLISRSFENGAVIPRQFTCDGSDNSPALEWSGAPASTKSFALIADDPDAPAGTWVHWVLWNLPAETGKLPESLPKKAGLDTGAKQGRNDFQKTGYNGPCPPPGKPHRYFFKLYALDTLLKLAPNATKADVEDAMHGHILAQSEWTGRYGR